MTGWGITNWKFSSPPSFSHWPLVSFNRLLVFFDSCSAPVCHLHELPLIHAEAGGAPVQDLIEWKLPSIGEDDRKTAGLECLQEAEAAETSSSRHQAERGVGEEVVIIPSESDIHEKLVETWSASPVVLRVVLLAPLVRHLPPVLAVSAGGHHHHVPPAVKVVQRVPGGAPDPVEVALALKCQEVLVLHRKVVGSHKPRGSTPAKDKFVRKKLDHNNLPFWVMFVKEWQWDVEARSEVLCGDARLGQHCPTYVEAEVLRVVRPRPRVEVEHNVVEAVVPIL